ncbi:LORF2 protein, partial [Crocuta crocuta]
TLMFIVALSIIAKLWKEPKCPSTNDWIKKWCCVCVCVYTHIHTMEYYSAIRKNEILPFAMRWMEPECIMLNDVSQRQKNTI